MPGGRISDEDIQKVREATDLVSLVGERVPLKQKGRDFWCCCPLHGEKTPSFKIDPSTQLWHCFGCDEGGDAFGFVMKLDDLTFPEAVRKLADRAHVEITESDDGRMPRSQKNRLKEVCDATADYYHLQLMRSTDDGAASARRYLSGRGLGGEIPKIWHLGFAPGRGSLIRHLTTLGFKPDEMIAANVAKTDRSGRLNDRFFNRVMFPIADQQGDFIAFGGRIIGQGEPKYLNSQETPIFHKSSVLYGLDKAKTKMASTGIAIVAEGYTDVISLHAAGLTNSVATLGTALTRNHIRMLSRHAGKKIVYLFDGDAAGQRATERALQFIDDSVTPEAGRTRIELCALTLPDNMDPAEYIDAHGAEAMHEMIGSAQPLILFGIERRLSKHNLETAEGRAAALSDAIAILAPIKDSILAKDYAAEIANKLHLREADVLEQLSRTSKPINYGDAHDSTLPANNAQSGVRMRHLSATERNRLEIEREFLSLSANNPLLAMDHANVLEGAKWHDKAHAEISTSILNTLMNNLEADPAEVVNAALLVNKNAASILTSAKSVDIAPSVLMRYLAEEIQIGDIEEKLAAIKAEVSRNPATEDQFSEMIALQELLNDVKNSHIALS